MSMQSMSMAVDDELRDDRSPGGPPPPLVDYGLALSGGGIRATLFHLGAIWRINQLGKLRDLGRITSVSGGSIAAALLAIAWPKLEFDDLGRATNLGDTFAKPVMLLAKMPLDAPIVALGMVPGIEPGTVLADVLDRYFFEGRTLQDLPGRWRGPALRVQCHRPDEWHGLALLPAVHGLVSDRPDPRPDRPPGAGRRGLGRLPAYRVALDRGVRSRQPRSHRRRRSPRSRSRHSDGSR